MYSLEQCVEYDDDDAFGLKQVIIRCLQVKCTWCCVHGEYI